MGYDLVPCKPNAELAKKIEEALKPIPVGQVEIHQPIVDRPNLSPLDHIRRWTSPQSVQQPPRSWAQPPVTPVTADLLDVIRLCSVHGKPYASRYILQRDGNH
jgi:hypothetical protein